MMYIFAKGQQSGHLFLLLLLLIWVGITVSCQKQTPIPVTRVVTRTAAPGETIEVTRLVVETIVEERIPSSIIENTPQSKDLVVCLSEEPASLYWYGRSQQASRAVQHATRSVQHALFTDNWTTLSYSYQPVGIEKMPNLADGDAIITSVEAREGDIIVDAQGQVTILLPGVLVRTNIGEVVPFEGSPVTLSQMVVEFTLKPRMWSDGTPVTAADSVYSFELDADPNTPTNKENIIRTAAYEAINTQTVRWTGIPGFLDRTYFTNLWPPLPYHAWQALTPAELLEADIANRFPIGDGPFVVDDWIVGEEIRLTPNPHYYQPDLPNLDAVIFRFVPNSNQLLAQLMSGQCDIGTQDSLDLNLTPFLLEAENSGLLQAIFQSGTVFEHIDFGINSYGNYGDDINRPDWFEDVRVRQATTLCTNRQRMMDEIVYGRTTIMHSYIPPNHPLYLSDLTVWPYDPVAANRLLDEVGFVDSDEDGVREYAGGRNGRFQGEPFVITLDTTANNPMRQQIAQLFQEDMVQCGITVNLETHPLETWFSGSLTGEGVFSRRFDLAGFAWLAASEPNCALFLSTTIPGPENEINPRHYNSDSFFNGWAGNNNTGWANQTFDQACQQALDHLPGQDLYEQGHKQAQLVFAQQLPIIPLFSHLKVVAARPEVLHFNVDSTQLSELYNLYEIDLTEPES